MTDNWRKTSFILDGDFDLPGDEPEEGSYRDKLFNLLEEILGRIEKLEKNSHRHKMQNPEYREEWANFVKRVKEPRLTRSAQSTYTVNENLNQKSNMDGEQILTIASRYLDRGLHTDTGWIDKPEWSADTEQLLRFAQAIYKEGCSHGREQGYSEGYSSGYDAPYYENSGY